MGETGIIVRFPGSLDPQAQEFRPTLHCYSPSPYPSLPFLPLPLPLPLPYPPPLISTSSTRSLLLSPLSPLISHSALASHLQLFGHLRALQTDSLPHGFATVHFYDLRHAEAAFAAIRMHPPPLLPSVSPLYVLPTTSNSPLPDAYNQGTLVLFNLHAHLSDHYLRTLFEAFGPIKELRDTPWKKNQRFVEFFDIRDAAKALKHMNGKEIHGKPLVIEFSRPGGHTQKLFHSTTPTFSSKKTLGFDVPTISSPSPRRRFATPRFHSSQSQFPHKKSSPNKVVPDPALSLEAEMGSMSLGEEVENGNVVKEEHCSRKNFSRKQSCESTKQQQLARNRHWKGKQAKKNETRFLIKEDAIVESASKDTRTTVMIKNIPNKYSQKLLLNMLDNHCIHCNEQIADGDDQPLSSYDFVYLPIDFNNKCNVGYGFVNMTSPEATLRLYKAFHLQHWEVFNSRKICEVTYARVQGLEALKEHFKNSKFPCEMEHYLPVVFSPPRDGRELTEPLAIVAGTTIDTTKPMPNGGGGDDDGCSSCNSDDTKSGGVVHDDPNQV